MSLAVGSPLRMAQRKWPDRQHWTYPMTVLGSDGHGTWAAAPRGTPARRGDEPVRHLSGFVVLVPHGDPWIVECSPGDHDVAVYVNIGTVPEIVGGDVVTVDLDLDVVLRRDGSVTIEDREEFAERRVGYPADLVELAERGAERAATILRGSADPFGASRWVALLADHGRSPGAPA